MSFFIYLLKKDATALIAHQYFKEERERQSLRWRFHASKTHCGMRCVLFQQLFNVSRQQLSPMMEQNKPPIIFQEIANTHFQTPKDGQRHHNQSLHLENWLLFLICHGPCRYLQHVLHKKADQYNQCKQQRHDRSFSYRNLLLWIRCNRFFFTSSFRWLESPSLSPHLKAIFNNIGHSHLTANERQPFLLHRQRFCGQTYVSTVSYCRKTTIFHHQSFYSQKNFFEANTIRPVISCVKRTPYAHDYSIIVVIYSKGQFKKKRDIPLSCPQKVGHYEN